MLRLHKQLHKECGGVCDWEEFGLWDQSSDLPVRGANKSYESVYSHEVHGLVACPKISSSVCRFRPAAVMPCLHERVESQ